MVRPSPTASRGARRPVTTAAVAVLACAAALAGCGARALNIPRPRGGLGGRPPPAEPSRFDVPITADVRAALAQLEAQVPPEIDRTGSWTMMSGMPVGVRYRVRREPFRFAASNGALRAETTLAISAEACVGGNIPLLGPVCQPVAGCGMDEPPRRVIVRTDTTLRFDPSWRLVSETRPAAPTFVDRCEVSALAFRVDVTDYVAQAVAEQIGQAARQMDASIAQRGDFRPRAQAMWTTLQSPVELGEGFWLTMRPEGVSLGALAIDPTTLRTAVSIVARPHVVAGERPAAPGVALPDLGSHGSAGAPGLHVTLDAEVPFARVTELVAARYRGRTMEIEGHRVFVRDVRVEGREGALVFALDVRFDSGPLAETTGTVYLAGLPDYDPQARALVVRDLDYTVDTRNALFHVAEWFMRGSLRDSLQRRARFPLGEQIDRLRERAQAAFSRPLGGGAHIRGTLSSVRPAGVYVTPTGVVVRVVADGTAEITQDASQLLAAP